MLFGLPPADPGIEVFVASQGMSQGLLQTQGAQIIPRATLRFGEVQVGAQWRNISSPAASGIAALFVKVRETSGTTQVEGAIFYRVRTGVSSSVARTAWEFDGAVRQTVGKLTLKLIAEYAPKEFEAGSSLYLEAGPSYEVGKKMSLSVNVGRRERAGPDYTSFNAGLTKVLGKVALDARLYATNHQDRGQRYRTRLVVSARLSL